MIRQAVPQNDTHTTRMLPDAAAYVRWVAEEVRPLVG